MITNMKALQEALDAMGAELAELDAERDRKMNRAHREHRYGTAECAAEEARVFEHCIAKHNEIKARANSLVRDHLDVVLTKFNARPGDILTPMFGKSDPPSLYVLVALMAKVRWLPGFIPQVYLDKHYRRLKVDGSLGATPGRWTMLRHVAHVEIHELGNIVTRGGIEELRRLAREERTA